MKIKIYREPNAFKRWSNRQFVSVPFQGREMEMLRLRWWPLVCMILYGVAIGLTLLAESFGRGTPV